MEATQFCHKLLEFDGTGHGYQWFINIEQFWNAQRLEEQQKFLEIENFLRGRALAWFKLWKNYNPNADKSVFDIAFMHRYVPDSRPILPEIFWNRVSDLDVTLEQIRASLENFESNQKLRQKRFTEVEDSDFNPQPEQEIATTPVEIQEKEEVEKDADATSNSTTDNKFDFTVHRSTSLEYEINEDPILDQNLDLEYSDLEATIASKISALSLEIEEKEQSPTLLDAEGSDSGTTSGNGGAEHTASNTAVDTVARAREEEARLEDGVPTVLGGGFQAQRCRRIVCPFVGKPRPLLAAVLPWDRGGGGTTEGLCYGVAPSSLARQREYAAVMNTAAQKWTMAEGKTHEMTNGKGWVLAEASLAEREEAAM